MSPQLRYASRLAAVSAAALLASTALPASAATFMVDFTTLNNSGVTGNARIDVNDARDRLQITFDVAGLEPGRAHVSHIHGLFTPSGQPRNSTVPTIAVDTDRDGFIEVAEGAATYGPIIVDLGNVSANLQGISNFSATYNLTNSAIFGAGFDADDLFPLDLREVVIHGLTVPSGQGLGTPGEVNGINGYLGILPVAAGEIRRVADVGAVPEPSTWAMMMLGFFGIGGAMRRAKPVIRRATLSYG